MGRGLWISTPLVLIGLTEQYTKKNKTHVYYILCGLFYRVVSYCIERRTVILDMKNITYKSLDGDSKIGTHGWSTL